ncbi:MAG: cyclopropane-fatty-acyl-phospholipid synthase [Verrucomicrobia bacterium]|nr:cyclopropane-fatty-acyl-phospholipid synthase [Verrucomicrobiota bacterium]
MALLDPILKPLIRSGSLRVIDWKGIVTDYGDGSGKPVGIRIHDRATAWRLLLNPQMEGGEAYMHGRLTIEEGTLYDFLDLLFRGVGLRLMSYPLSGVTERIRGLMRRVRQFNPAPRSSSNVAHHYDLSDVLYDQFLDVDRQYSCGYFLSGTDSLEQAQAQKKRHLAAKLLLKKGEGQRILDIGSGWGGLGLYLGSSFGADVTGLTLSREQHELSNRRARNAGLADHVRFKLEDYRRENGKYDRIVSVGMFEHVGINHFDEFFRKVSELLTDDGVAVLHSIGRPDGAGHTNPWIEKYIFPGGYSPSLSEVLHAVERAGLLVTDVEILRIHYAETLRLWHERFEQKRSVIRALYDEEFCRMWEFYLISSELCFRHQGLMVFQIQLAKRADTVPITRDYMTRFEMEHPPAPIPEHL